MKYSDKLKDPRWQKKRLQILERDKWTCRACCSKENTLHVHHLFYIPKLEPWEIPDGLLVTLCCDCHNPGPCENMSSCDKCPDYGNGEYDCWGYEDPPKEMITLIGQLLDTLWRNGDHFGGPCAQVILSNAHYALKPE